MPSQDLLKIYVKNTSDFQQEPDCNRLVGKQTSMCTGGWYAEKGGGMEEHVLPLVLCLVQPYGTFSNSTFITHVEEERKKLLSV